MKKEDIEAAALCAMDNFGTPDISGGYVIEDGQVFFKDKHGHTSMVMDEEAYHELKKKDSETFAPKPLPLKSSFRLFLADFKVRWKK